MRIWAAQVLNVFLSETFLYAWEKKASCAEAVLEQF